MIHSCAGPDKHPLVQREAIKFQTIAVEPMIMFSTRESPLFHSSITAMCEQAGLAGEVARA